MTPYYKFESPKCPHAQASEVTLLVYKQDIVCLEFKGTAHGVKPIQVHCLCIIIITVHNY